MIAIHITTVREDSPEWIKALQNRTLIRFNRHRIIIPDRKNKRIYLSKRRLRELLSYTTISYEWPFEKMQWCHYHTPKAILEYAKAHLEEEIKQPIPSIINKPSIQKKNIIQRIFGLFRN